MVSLKSLNTVKVKVKDKCRASEKNSLVYGGNAIQMMEIQL